MTYAINVRTRPTTAFSYRSNFVYESPLVLENDGEYALPQPQPDAYARRLAEEAEVWLSHTRARARMKEETVVRKALQSLAFTMRHRAHDFAVPSKLSGVSKHQPTLWQLVRSGIGLGTPLHVEEIPTDNRPRLAVSFDGDTLGEVQSKHVPWLRPLLPFGAGIYLVRVTGQERDYTLGCNVAFGRVGAAVAALNHALGTDVGGDGYGGDGASQRPAEAAAVKALPRPDHGGDGAPGSNGQSVRDHLRLVSLDPSVAKPQADTNTEDIVLYREIDGTAKATVEHAQRHSQSVEWGYHGSGPADLARSILLAFTDEANADRLYQRFKAEVIAVIPRAGGVIRAADVQAWIAANDG